MELSEFIVLIGLKWSLEHVIAHIAAMFFRQKRERGKRKKGRSARRNGNGKGRQEDERREDGRLPTQLRCSGTEEPQSWQQTQWGGGSKIGGGGGGEQDRYFSAQGKALLLQTAVLQHASSEGNKRNKKVSLGEQELQSWQLPRVNAVHACTTASSD